jgi:prepilin-type N-terminal cleavage/methylation domain-containing protein
MRRWGFTLIELLVVIAIIAILGGDSVSGVCECAGEGASSKLPIQHAPVSSGNGHVSGRL